MTDLVRIREGSVLHDERALAEILAEATAIRDLLMGPISVYAICIDVLCGNFFTSNYRLGPLGILFKGSAGAPTAAIRLVQC